MKFEASILLFSVLMLSIVTFALPSYASGNDPYDSGYYHGCDDVGISDSSERYINQPEKGPSFHTNAFMNGYYAGFDACSNNSDSNNNEIPNCDFDEFVNDDNECEKIPPNPATAVLPPCDGSLQDCVTENGDVCLAGASTHECELPNPGDSVVIPGVTFPEDEEEPSYPYCDLLPDGFRDVSCHDRKDYDQETLLYPCNDGTHKERWQDCEDVSGYDYG